MCQQKEDPREVTRVEHDAFAVFAYDDGSVMLDARSAGLIVVLDPALAKDAETLRALKAFFAALPDC